MVLGVAGRCRCRLGAVAFRYMILGFTYVFTGHRITAPPVTRATRSFRGLGIWFVVLAPVVGGLIYGPLVSRFAPEARGHGVPEVMFAVAGWAAGCARRCRS